MTPEGKVKEQVKKLLSGYTHYRFMPVQMGMGVTTVDFLICHKGRFIAVETKAPGKKPNALQERTIKEIEFAGGIVFVIDGVNGELEKLQLWLHQLNT